MDPNDDNKQTFTITSIGQSNKQTSDKKVIQIRTSVSHGWIQFPVHHFVRRWQKERQRSDHSKQKIFLASCRTCRADLRFSPISQHGKYHPFLMVNLKPVKKSRTRRSVKQKRARKSVKQKHAKSVKQNRARRSFKQNCAKRSVKQNRARRSVKQNCAKRSVKQNHAKRSVKQKHAKSVKQNRARKNVKQPSPMNVCTAAEQTGCCRENLTVSFSKLGWNFIIAPGEYNAYYCKGRCSGRFNSLITKKKEQC